MMKTLKKIFYLITVVLAVISCNNGSSTIDPLNLQDRWGVAFYEYPRYPQDGCSYRLYFLPFKDAVDRSALDSSDSIFKYQYDEGIEFLISDARILNQIRFRSINSRLQTKKDNNRILFWSFTKFKFHVEKNNYKPLGEEKFERDTLFFKNNMLPYQYYYLHRSIVIDTAVYKKKIDSHRHNKAKMDTIIRPC